MVERINLPNRVLLIGGTSHTGKSTLARKLAEALELELRSTDKLARHPGRPWATPPAQVPSHVSEHYLSLTPRELLADVRRHYAENVWPQVAQMVAECTNNTAGPVLEGSAILPDPTTALPRRQIAPLWLTAEDELLAHRIRAGSRYGEKSGAERDMIERFIQRTLLFNELVVQQARRHGFPLLDVGRIADIEQLAASALKLLAQTPISQER
jgi:2-phosphoglycerate kinase